MNLDINMCWRFCWLKYRSDLPLIFIYFFEKKPLIFRNRKKERSLLVKRIVPARWKLRYLFLSFSRMLRYFAGRDKEEISNPIH